MHLSKTRNISNTITTYHYAPIVDCHVCPKSVRRDFQVIYHFNTTNYAPIPNINQTHSTYVRLPQISKFSDGQLDITRFFGPDTIDVTHRRNESNICTEILVNHQPETSQMHIFISGYILYVNTHA